MNPFGSFTGESLLEQGKSMVKKTGDVAAQGIKVTAQTAASQLTGGTFGDTSGSVDATDQSQAAAAKAQQDFVRELYGAEHNQQTQPNQTQPQTQPQPAQVAPQPQAVDMEQQHRLASTRQQLSQLLKQQHMDSYFNPTFNRTQQAQEESVVEKNDREDQEKQFEEFEKQKKKPDFALQRAKTRTEMSPGASG